MGDLTLLSVLVLYICGSRHACPLCVCSTASVGHEEVPLFMSLVMGRSACSACLHVTAKFGEHGQQNIWWPGGLQVGHLHCRGLILEKAVGSPLDAPSDDGGDCSSWWSIGKVGLRLAMTTNHSEEGILHRSCPRRQHMGLGSCRLEPVTC